MTQKNKMEKVEKRKANRTLSFLIAVIFIFSFFAVVRPLAAQEEVATNNQVVDLEKLAKEQDKERKELEKKEKEDLKKLRKQGVPVLPAESESVEEKLKRKEEAKKRLALFKEELQKKTETVSPAGSAALNPSQEAALAAEKQRAAELLKRKLELEKELAALEADDSGAAAREMEKAKRQQAQKEERLAREARAKAERDQKAVEKKKKEELELKLKAEKEKQRLELENKNLKEKRQKELEKEREKAEREKSKSELEKKRAEEKKQRDLETRKREEEAKAKQELEKKQKEEAKRAEKLRKEKEKSEAKKRQELEKQKREDEKRIRESEKAKKRLEAERKKESERKAREEAKKKEEVLKAAKEKKVLEDAESIIAAHKSEETVEPAAPQSLPEEPVRAVPVQNAKESSKHLKRAQDLLEKRAYTESRTELEKVLATEPENFIAKNLMAIVLEGEYIAEKEKGERDKILAGIVEEKEMHDRFQSEMDRIDGEIQKSAEEGNRLYEKGSYQEANQSYLKVRALEAERRMIIDNILEKLAERNQKPPEEMVPAEKAVQVDTLLKEAAIYSEQERWDDAAEKYEAVFQLDPLNKKASDGLDELRKKIMKSEKDRREEASEELKTTLDQKVEFFVSEAKAAQAKGDLETAKTLAERALSLNPKDKAARTVLGDLEKTKESVKA